MIDKKYIFYLCMTFMSFDSSAKSIFIGDSLTLSLAKGAQEQDVLEYYYLDRSGLMNEAFYDWLAFVQRMPVSSADLIIVSLGANDGMATSAANPYSQKIRQFISVLKTRYPAASIIWVLPPSMKNTQTENTLVNTRRIISETAVIAGYAVFDPRPLTGWAWTYSVNGIVLRTADGIHYTPEAGKLISEQIYQAVRQN
ncbi:TPA: GDSL-type esterase/lipase family protein [Morganella morganii]